MHHIRRIVLVIGLLLLVASVTIIVKETVNKEQIAQTPSISPSFVSLTSPVFKNNESLPGTYTCKGDELVPPLIISSHLKNAESYVIIVHDVDANNGDAVHWLVWNVPATTVSIDGAQLPAEARIGTNSFGATGYTTPCPSPGTGKHKYVFELYALNKMLDIPSGANRDAVMLAMNGNLLEQVDLAGTYQVE